MFRDFIRTYKGRKTIRATAIFNLRTAVLFLDSDAKPVCAPRQADAGRTAHAAGHDRPEGHPSAVRVLRAITRVRGCVRPAWGSAMACDCFTGIRAAIKEVSHRTRGPPASNGTQKATGAVLTRKHGWGTATPG